jgi:plasmid maintenance system antidote protein VapI
MSKRKKTVAEILLKAIQDSGKPVAVIAREAGIVQPVLHRFVTGERTITLATAEKLMAYFGFELRKRE